MADSDVAPNFSGQYPNAGVLIGPAWRDAWTVLADGQWHRGIDLAREVADRRDVMDMTVRNLLREAAKREILEIDTRTTKTPGRRSSIKHSWYRRPL